jgi:hypothetical protein
MRNHLNILPWVLASCLGCLLFFLPTVARATQPPVGTWDCVVSGSEQGVAHLFFNADGTLAGRVILTFSGKTTGTFTNKGITYTNFVGGARLDGRWSYATPTSTNRIVGFINGVSGLAGTTTSVTNGLSFSGTARGTRLTLMASGYSGPVTFRGIPLETTNALTGTSYANGSKQGTPAPFTEVFDLTPAPELDLITTSLRTTIDCSSTNVTLETDHFSTTNLDSIINITNYFTYVIVTQQVCFVTNTVTTTLFNQFPANYYAVVGGGPAYEYTGRILVSRQNYAAFYQARGVNDEFITVYAGPFNPSTGRGSLLGTDGVSRNIKYAIFHGPTSGGP